MSSRFYSSNDAALAAICTSDDVAATAFLFNGDRPTVIRVLREEEQYGGGYLLIIKDDGLGVNRKRFRTVDELILLLASVKSDDVVGRVKTYEAIVKGENVMEPGVPESFKVLIKELQSLALDVKVLTENREEIEIKIQDDDMTETAKDIGLLVGDDGPRMSQTIVAAREAETMRAAAAAAPSIGEEGEVLGGVTDKKSEKDDDAEASDEEVRPRKLHRAA